ncbi:putative RAC-beta serine [Monocercomonoides exilis]|uniref:putative RAC-beta serine n=1 Tax=Monocercomonoides exilis TaxID=2049356 RepID=UPI0035594F39|nr:putative RAC-beta serine [Monocercomonoides exilis]|eukprot:MONOS_5844.1-p1 / transcript=MONOS_5844.1 / gene=MONOS_5844 / organism=Monocercomonoides_exilis_PA203 / gene_product=RAC-beta serine / transcript_product=RAC-beta serine / location=Mono_scaffold00175:84846-87698(+) / protein_length=734 / sequence_SO=supercontig / SO=protein_coding / is_pseudo=false
MQNDTILGVKQLKSNPMEFTISAIVNYKFEAQNLDQLKVILDTIDALKIGRKYLDKEDKAQFEIKDDEKQFTPEEWLVADADSDGEFEQMDASGDTGTAPPTTSSRSTLSDDSASSSLKPSPFVGSSAFSTALSGPSPTMPGAKPKHIARILSAEPVLPPPSQPAVPLGHSITREANKVTVKDFELLACVGKGSFGKVLQVRKTPEFAAQSKNGYDGHIYAMKILKKSHIFKHQQQLHTITERTVMATIEHMFIERLHYAFQTSEKLYMVTDYANGGELFIHLTRNIRFKPDVARFLIAEIVDVIHHLHRKHIVYRDLKPENVLLQRDGHVMLIDFGLAKILEEEEDDESEGSEELEEEEVEDESSDEDDDEAGEGAEGRDEKWQRLRHNRQERRRQSEEKRGLIEQKIKEREERRAKRAEKAKARREREASEAKTGERKERKAATTGTYCGTEEYMAPEVMLGRPYTKAVDWWNVGYLFYVMLVGDHPFVADSPFEMRRKTLACEYSMPSYIPEVAQDFIRRLLIAEPSHRLGSLPPERYERISYVARRRAEEEKQRNEKKKRRRERRERRKLRAQKRDAASATSTTGAAGAAAAAAHAAAAASASASASSTSSSNSEGEKEQSESGSSEDDSDFLWRERRARGVLGGHQLKQHPLFKGISFPKLRRKLIPSPFVPRLPKGDLDLSFVDEEFLAEPAYDTPPGSPAVHPHISDENWEKMDAAFDGFDFNEDVN